jgi:Na+-driven multidrug efflux pump
MAWPNLLVMLAQSSTGLIEMFFVARLGTNALTGMALVMPLVILMQNMSQGAMGGGISSAVARALGANRRDDADSYVLHAIAINGMLGALFTIIRCGFSTPSPASFVAVATCWCQALSFASARYC